VNDRLLPAADWSYHPGEHLLTLRSIPPGTVLLRFGAAVDEPGATVARSSYGNRFLARSHGPAAPGKLLYRVSYVPIFNLITHIYLHVRVCLDA
jgi:hypothetical protein